MEFLPKEIEDIILDYKAELEHRDKFSRTLAILKYIQRSKKCNICERHYPSKLIFHTLVRLKHNPSDITNYTFRYCYYRPHIF